MGVSGLRERVPAWGGPQATLLAVVVLFVALASVVALETPAWESADEPGHVQNVETLVAGHWYRIPSDLTKHNPQSVTDLKPLGELHQAPLYYLLLAGFQRVAGVAPHVVNPGPATFATPRGLYLHHSAAQHRFLLLLRFPNVVLGVLTILATFLATRLMTTDPWTPVVAAAIVAFVPRFVFLSAFVTNDNLVDLLGAVLLYCALRAVGAVRWRWAVLTGVTVGLVVITKLSALVAVLVVIPVVIAQRGWIRRIRVTALIAAAALVVSGWYLIQNQVRYGDPLALSAAQHYLTYTGGNGELGTPYVVHDPLRLILDQVPVRIFTSFWYESGWGEFHWPATTSLLFWLGLAFGLAGLAARAQNALWLHRRAQLAVLSTAAVAGFASVWIVAFSTATYAARLAFVGLPALASLVALGLERWKPPIRFVLPLMGVCGALVAIEQNILTIHWQ